QTGDLEMALQCTQRVIRTQGVFLAPEESIAGRDPGPDDPLPGAAADLHHSILAVSTASRNSSARRAGGHSCLSELEPGCCAPLDPANRSTRSRERAPGPIEIGGVLTAVLTTAPDDLGRAWTSGGCDARSEGQGGPVWTISILLRIRWSGVRILRVRPEAPSGLAGSSDPRNTLIFRELRGSWILRT